MLAEHWRTLKPGGLLIVDAPNIALICSDDILEEWFIDKHLFHFSAGTLARLLHANGFEVIDGPDPSDRENLLFAARKRAVAARPIARGAARGRSWRSSSSTTMSPTARAISPR